MKSLKLIPVLFLVLLFFVITKIAFSQDTQTPPPQPPSTILDVSPQLDSKLTGVWTTDSKTANFGKIEFGSDGSFSGYTFSTDKTPFATGTYQIVNNGIYASTTVNDPNMNKGDAVSMNYTFQSYSIKDTKLTLNMTDRKASYEYTKSK